MLAELLIKQKEWIVQYHEHDSLLENRPEEELTEDERKAAWEEFEQDKMGVRNNYPSGVGWCLLYLSLLFCSYSVDFKIWLCSHTHTHTRTNC